MTEEITIDGVDVSGCEYYQIEANELYPKAQYCGSMRNTFCENEPNCYYKQLKRLETENAKLKEALEEIRGINNSFFDMNYVFVMRIKIVIISLNITIIKLIQLKK